MAIFETIPVSMPDCRQFHLSPGKCDKLQAAIIEQFAPRFAPGAVALYLRDSTNKELASVQPILKQLGIPPEQQDRLPTVVLWDKKRNWLFLVEVAAVHCPMSAKRANELETMLRGCTAGLVFVSAFSDMEEFNEHLENIAWKTHAWLANVPDHMIHLD